MVSAATQSLINTAVESEEAGVQQQKDVLEAVKVKIDESFTRRLAPRGQINKGDLGLKPDFEGHEKLVSVLDSIDGSEKKELGINESGKRVRDTPELAMNKEGVGSGSDDDDDGLKSAMVTGGLVR